MVGIAQQFIYNGWSIYCPLLEDQLRSFVEDPDTGKLAGTGAHDDAAIAFMLACLGILRLLRNASIDLDSLDTKTIDMAAEALSTPKDVTVDNPAFDENGRYLLSFTEMFTKSGRVSHHATNR